MDNKKEYIEQLFTAHGIDWLSTREGNEHVMVSFLENKDDVEAQLERIAPNTFAKVRIIPRMGEKGCMGIFEIIPRKLETPTLSEAFAELARSTADFHERFETRKHSDLRDARAVMDEEYNEVQEEINNVVFYGASPANLVKEMADLWVTGLGALLHAGVSEAVLAAALLEVAAKNDAKTLDNCVWHNGKVTRREKLEKGNG